MINENTINTLQVIAFGTDIDSLESYVVDCEQASKLTNMSRYMNRLEQMKAVLSEVKPDSVALRGQYELKEIKNDKYQSAFNKYGNMRKLVAYGSEDSEMFSDILDIMRHSKDEIIDLLGILNVKGLDVICTYRLGYLCKIYLVGESRKYIDITYDLDERIPKYIKTMSSFKEVELRGKLTILNSNNEYHKEYLNLESYIMHCIRNKIHVDKLDIIFNELLAEDIDLDTQWDRLDFMISSGLNVAMHCLVRSIDAEIIHRATVDIDNYFEEQKVIEQIDYEHYGFEVRSNNNVDISVGFICVMDDADWRLEFESTIKNIATSVIGNKQYIKIVKTHCNNRFDIDTISIDDIYKLEENNVAIGSKIKFKVIEGKAELL